MARSIFQEQYTSGTGGLTPTNSAYNQRALNTTVENNITGCSLGTNVVSLPAGTYHIRGYSLTFAVGHQLTIYDFTNSVELLVGMNAVAVVGGAAPHTPNVGIVDGDIILTATTNIGLNDYIASSPSGFLGAALSGPNPEVYAQITIED